MAMTAGTKARLRAAAAKKKGTTTLRGFDHDKWTEALEMAASGARHVPINVQRLIDVRKTDKKSFVKTTFDRAWYPNRGDEYGWSHPIAWGRFRHDSVVHLEAMKDKLPYRIVRVKSYDGEKQTEVNGVVFDIAALLTILDLTVGIARVKKYVVGYGEQFVDNNPGVGQLFVATKNPPTTTGVRILVGSEAIVTGFGIDGVVKLQDTNDPIRKGVFRANSESRFKPVTMIPGLTDGHVPANRAERIDAIFARFGLEID